MCYVLLYSMQDPSYAPFEKSRLLTQISFAAKDNRDFTAGFEPVMHLAQADSQHPKYLYGRQLITEQAVMVRVDVMLHFGAQYDAEDGRARSLFSHHRLVR